MGVEIVTARSLFTRLNMVVLVAAIILLLISLLSSPKAQVMFSAYAILLIIFILVGQFRVNRAGDLKQLGERAVQTLWLSTSLSLVAITIPPAPYFELSQPIVAAFIILGVILVILGSYGLLNIRRLTGVSLSV